MLYCRHVKLIFVRLKGIKAIDYHVTWKSVQSLRRSLNCQYHNDLGAVEKYRADYRSKKHGRV
ncbi:TPA: DUF3136 domain-containing protein [Salmonella enterica]|nr:DUF3136 domain-containing protein [Salmonella enterica]